MTLRRIAWVVSLMGMAPQAHAHGSVEGLGYFMGGFLHPLLEPAHLVALVSLLLLIAQRGLQGATWFVATLAAATAFGLIVAALGVPVATDTALLVAAALTGVVVVAARPLPQMVVVVLTATIGLGVGLGSHPEGLIGASRYAALAGTWLGSCLYVISGATMLDEFKRPWVSVLIRVVGSWMVAASVMVLALHAAEPKVAPQPTVLNQQPSR